MDGRQLRWIYWALAATILFSVPLRSADFTFYVGGVMPGSIDYQNVITSLDKSPIYGFRLATNFIPFFGLEHTLGFSSDYLFPQNISAIQDAKGFVYNTNLILNFPVKIKSMVPYFTAGAGVICQYGDEDMPVGTKFAFNYGGGLKFPHLVGPLGLRLDVRGYRATGIFSSSLNLFEVSGGILFSLGK
jgi:hypothetical protein